MKLPSSSSLLLASLAVSASSSSSLSALAAPAGDLPEDSTSPSPAAPCRDGALTRSLDHPQSRVIITDIAPALKPIIGMLAVARDFESAADEDSNGPTTPTPPAPPSSPAGAPAAPKPPVKPPVNLPVNLPSPPVAPPKARQASVVGNLVSGLTKAG